MNKVIQQGQYPTMRKHTDVFLATSIFPCLEGGAESKGGTHQKLKK